MDDQKLVDYCQELIADIKSNAEMSFHRIEEQINLMQVYNKAIDLAIAYQQILNDDLDSINAASHRSDRLSSKIVMIILGVILTIPVVTLAINFVGVGNYDNQNQEQTR